MLRWLVIAIGMLTGSALSGVGAYQLMHPLIEGSSGPWQEIAWPFPRDGWPAGRAFRCETCGGVEIYVRPKIGFCNCDTGVADDDEVDRVTDLDLIGESFAPTEAGKVVRVADLTGRARAYDLRMPDGSDHTGVGIALNHRCDLLVAVAQGKADRAELTRLALDYLATGAMHHWMLASVGRR